MGDSAVELPEAAFGRPVTGNPACHTGTGPALQAAPSRNPNHRLQAKAIS